MDFKLRKNKCIFKHPLNLHPNLNNSWDTERYPHATMLLHFTAPHATRENEHVKIEVSFKLFL